MTTKVNATKVNEPKKNIDRNWDWNQRYLDKTIYNLCRISAIIAKKKTII